MGRGLYRNFWIRNCRFYILPNPLTSSSSPCLLFFTPLLPSPLHLPFLLNIASVSIRSTAPSLLSDVHLVSLSAFLPSPSRHLSILKTSFSDSDLYMKVGWYIIALDGELDIPFFLMDKIILISYNIIIFVCHSALHAQVNSVAQRFAVPPAQLLSVNADLVGLDPEQMFSTPQVRHSSPIT